MEVDRRSWLRGAAASALVNLNPAARGANDKIVLALIGGRNQGHHDVVEAVRQGAEIKTICDVDEAISRKTGADVAKLQGRQPGAVKDFRRVLEDRDIDGVIIATPDHWHAIPTLLACQAGKDIYVEKPLSQTVREGQLMRDAARRFNRVVQVGTQRRSGEHFRSAVEYVASGKLGKICLIKAWICQVRPSIGTPPDGEPPAGVDYDMWLGPAPQRPFNPNRFHYNWRFFWDYGNTELGNQGVHMLDVAIWGIQELRGMERCLPSHVSGNSAIYWLHDAKEVPDTQVLTYDYGDFLLIWEMHSFQKHHPIEGATDGTAFYGSEATLVVRDNGWTVYPKDGSPGLNVKASGGSHMRNFLDCMRSRQQPHSDIEIGRLSTMLCHLGNVCCRLGRDVRFDPSTERFGDDTQANTLLTKEYRAPYTLPQV